MNHQKESRTGLVPGRPSGLIKLASIDSPEGTATYKALQEKWLASRFRLDPGWARLVAEIAFNLGGAR